MRCACLNARRIKTRRGLHTALQRALRLPAWYGRNLDALHDCLTDLQEEVTLVIRSPQSLDVLGGYGEALLQVLRDCQEENPRFRLTLEEDELPPT